MVVPNEGPVSLPHRIDSHRVQWNRDDGFMITDDRERLDLPTVHGWLSEESSWASGRSMDLVANIGPPATTQPASGM